MWLNRELSCRDYGLLVPGVAGRRWPLAPNLAPREPVSLANVRKLELIVDSSCITVTCKQSPVKARPPGGGTELAVSLMRRREWPLTLGWAIWGPRIELDRDLGEFLPGVAAARRVGGLQQFRLANCVRSRPGRLGLRPGRPCQRS
jgi:hypothetical protein